MADANSFPTTLGPFTVGDHWQTRTGEVRRVVAVDLYGEHPILALDPENGETTSYDANGFERTANDRSARDLVEKIVPKRKAWVVFDPRDVADDTVLQVNLFGYEPGPDSGWLVCVPIEFEVTNDGA